MNRRDALKAFTSLVAGTGLTVTPITAHDLEHVEVVLLKAQGRISDETAARLKRIWEEAIRGTALEPVRAVVFDDGLDVEFVRTR